MSSIRYAHNLVSTPKATGRFAFVRDGYGVSVVNIVFNDGYRAVIQYVTGWNLSEKTTISSARLLDYADCTA